MSLARKTNFTNFIPAFQRIGIVKTSEVIYKQNISSGQIQPRTGILMLNMGGPTDQEEVQDFLIRLFIDRDIIQIPFQKYLGPFIAKRRTPEIKKKYAEIGGGSPIYKWTNLQGTLLCQKLDSLLPAYKPYKHYIGFRYAKPLIEDTMQKMEEKKETTMEWSIIDRWCTNAYLVKCFAVNIQDEIKKFPEEKQHEVFILFSAHSLPLKQVNRGDPYVAEVGATVQLIMDELDLKYPYRLAWQSKVGPVPWLSPSMIDSIKGLVQRGIKNILFVPIAFTSDHIETLHELDIEYIELAEKVGAEQVRRCAAPNDHPLFIDALYSIVSKHLKSTYRCSEQFLQCCQLCSNRACFKSKEWFRYITKKF